MSRILAPTIAIALVLCIGSVASQPPTIINPTFEFQFQPFDPACGLKVGVDTWSAVGNVTGNLTGWLKAVFIRTPFSGCIILLMNCSSNQDQLYRDQNCYCSGITGDVYHLNITLKARHIIESGGEVEAQIIHNSLGGPHVEEIIGNLPVVYEEVMVDVEVKTVPGLLESESGDNLRMMIMMSSLHCESSSVGNLTLNSDSPNVTFITSSPTVELQFCARNLLPGSTVSVDGVPASLTNDQQCVTKTMASAPSAVTFGYTQPDTSCDTGKTFHIRLTAPNPNESNGCQLLMMNKFWIAALATATLFLAW